MVGQFCDHMAKDPFLTVAPLTAMEKAIQKLRLWHPDSCLGHLPHAPVLPGWRWAELGRAERNWEQRVRAGSHSPEKVELRPGLGIICGFQCV